MQLAASAYTPDPIAAMAGSIAGAATPEFPTADEARAWLLVTHEGQRQDAVADKMKTTQGAVSKMVRRASEKVAGLVATGIIDRDELVTHLRRRVGLAART